MTRLSLILLTVILSGSAWAETTLTYQGRLANAGQAANGLHDFVFRLFDDEISGSQSGTDVAVAGVDVTGGVFTVELDFGDAPFNSSPRWLEIDVREAGTGMYTTLSPRQRIGASPFAIETLFVAPGAVDTAALQNDSVTTSKIANGNVFTDDLANFAVATNKLSNQAVTRLKLANDSVGTAQIENGTVASVDIRDGTITAVDVAGGLYSNKSDLYEVLGNTMTLLTSPQSQTISCADANDLPLSASCGRSSQTPAYLATSMHYSNWTSNSTAAAVTCSALNIHPSNPSGNPLEVRATLLCVAVP